MKESLAIPVVCIVVERFSEHGQPQILIQRRTKKKAQGGYPAIWELPQGRIRTGETILDAARRELKEETNLELTGINHLHASEFEHILSSSVNSFKPLLCTFDIEHNFIGLGMVVSAMGTPQDTEEASEHRWVNQREAEDLLYKQEIVPLDSHIIREYFRIGGNEYLIRDLN